MSEHGEKAWVEGYSWPTTSFSSLAFCPPPVGAPSPSISLPRISLLTVFTFQNSPISFFAPLFRVPKLSREAMSTIDGTCDDDAFETEPIGHPAELSRLPP